MHSNFILDDCLGFIVAKTNNMLKKTFFQHLRDYNITPEQWAVLNRLWEMDGISPKELSELIFKDVPNVLRILDKLQRKELIIRKTNPQDKRASIIYLTEKGATLKKELVPIVVKINQQAVAGISPQQLKQLKLLLNKVYDNLK